MTTLEQLSSAAQKQGFKFEAFTSMFYNRGNGLFWEAKDQGTTYFQFTTDNQHYYWFKGYNYRGIVEMFFLERYSANSGYSIKTYKREREALEKLNIKL